MKETRFRNGVRHPGTLKATAARLRKEGKTHREIAKTLGISLGSADLWTRGIILSQAQRQAIQKRKHKHQWTLAERKSVAERFKPFRIRYSDRDLIKRIQDFYAKNGRIPLKREFNSLWIFRKRFGSWNNAIRIAGFDPNPVLFAKKFTAKDGHHCDSFSETIIDDWLSARGVCHERNWKYGGTKMTADFFIAPNIIIEFFGLAGVQRKYDALVEKKKVAAEKLGLRLIALYPVDLFPCERFQTNLSTTIP